MKELPLVIDFFAGGGGASVGIEMALGRQVDIAVNHDPEAIRMHTVNHPNTLHLTEDIFKVDLSEYIKGRKVGLLWASPTCTHFSRAKGGTPLSEQLRVLPWSVYKHAKKFAPSVICMENVCEIKNWCRLEDGKPVKGEEGTEYNRFINAMRSLGYEFDSRELVAADYGAPTTRKRWYAIFRNDGKPINWPEPTHSKNGAKGLEPWVPVHTVLNLSDFGKSIFDRKKPLAEKTLRRTAAGLKKFVFECDNPFIYQIQTSESAPFMIQVNHGGENFRGQSLTEPLPTITTKHGFGIVSPRIERIEGIVQGLEKRNKKNALIASFIEKFYKSGSGQSIHDPIHTITTSPGHFGMVSVQMIKKDVLLKNGVSEETIKKCNWVAQYMIEYYGCSIGSSMYDPLPTVVTKDRFALITVLGTDYVLLDIYLRMLSPEELKKGQGFPDDYIIDRDINWKKYKKSEQVARIGNSVVPEMAKLLVEANCSYLKVGERIPCINIDTEASGQLKMIV